MGRPPGVLALVLGAALAVPASAVEVDCANAPGYDVRYAYFFETIPSVPDDRCHDTFKCAKPESLGAFIEKVDSGCDAEAGPCAVRLVFPLEFRGNRENIDDVGLFAAPTPRIYWFDGEADATCTPWNDPDCGQVSVCNRPPYDVIDTYLHLGTATCADPVPTNHSGTFSIVAWSCPVGASCPKKTPDTFDVTPPKVTKALGCVEPPKEACNGDASCTDCTAGGAGPGGGPPGVGGPGSPPTGPKATLRYVGGGAGSAGLPGAAAWSVTLGRGWSHDYAERIVLLPDESRVFLITKHGTFREWSLPDVAGVYQAVSPSSEYRTLTWLGTGLGWELRELDGTVHAFGADGLWLSTTDRNGNPITATYSGSTLASVDFPDGRREDFVYDAGTGKLAFIDEVGVDGVTTSTWGYTWTGDDLTRIDRPDGTALVFTYGDPMHPGSLTRMELEGSDGTSIRVLRGWEYDARGNVTRTWTGDASPTGSAAVDVWTFAFDDPEEPTVTTLTDPVGQEITYQLGRDTVSSNVRVEAISGDCPACGLAPNTQLFYEDPGHPLLPTRTVDGRGFETVMSYDAFGQLVSRTEAMGAPEERTTTWTYDATYPALLTSLEQPSVVGGASIRSTDFTLDGSGNATHRTLSGVEGGSAFSYTTVTTYTAEGQPATVDPPGHGSDDGTSFTYDPARGNLLADTRKDPLIGTTTFGHDAFNRRTSVTDPNGVETRTAYDELDRVTEVRLVGASPPTDDLVTTHAYSVLGDLFRTTLPRGNVVEYGYDAAGRLVSVERKPDASTPGERVLYTLDAAGNRTLEELQHWDAGASGWVTVSATAFEYSNRCQVDRVVQAPGTPEEAMTEYAYDCGGNLAAQWDPNHPRFPEEPAAPPPPPDADPASLSLRTHQEAPATTIYGYDALDRLVEVTQPWGGDGGGQAVTRYRYDLQDHLVQIVDAEGNVTTYDYSDRDLLTGVVSPVSGTTTHGYDEHGELTSTTDARGVTVLREVDELDRVRFLDSPDPALDTSFLYDLAPAECAEDFHRGRLAEILRDGRSLVSCYDRFGRTTRDGELTFAHDGNGNRTQVGYPGGVLITYAHDFADRETSLSLQVGAEPVHAIVSAAAYLPSGPLTFLALGNGLTEDRSFDRRYAPEEIGLSGVDHLAYQTDAVGNVTRIDRTLLGSTFALLYRYQDMQYFLTAGSGPWGPRRWTYDRIGNRLVEARGPGVGADSGPAESLYTYETNPSGGHTSKLLEITGPVGDADEAWRHVFRYDEAGNQTMVEPAPAGFGVGASLLGYDDASRLASLGTASGAEEAAVTYDGRGLFAASHLTRLGSADFERTEAVYGSAGVLHALRRQGERSGPGDGDGGAGGATTAYDTTTYLLYFAGRPVALFTRDALGGSPDRLVFLTTDHLGTPVTATDAAGAAVWHGGLSPFGTPYSFTGEGVAGGDGDPGGGGSDGDDPDVPPAEPPPPPPPPPGDDGRDGSPPPPAGGPPCEGAECDGREDPPPPPGDGEPCQGAGCEDGRQPPPPGDGGDGRDGGGAGGGGGTDCTGADCDDGRDGGGGGGGGGEEPCTTDCFDGRSAPLDPRATLASAPGEIGLFLRFPGQWDDTAFAAAHLPGGIYQNGYRWYSPAVGRYTRPDPLKITGGANLWLYDSNTYLYAWANPIVVTDPLGLYGTNDCSYYDQRCDECGGDYYCRLAPLACNTFPMYPDPDPNTDNDFEGWARCTRQCLQECDANNFDDRRGCESDPCAGTGSFFDESHQVCHRVCYSFCHFWGTWGGGEPSMQPVFK